jgi:hypothetical protein
MMAECKITTGELLPTLNKDTSRYFYARQIGCTKIEMYTRFDPYLIPLVYDEDRFTIRQLRLPNKPPVLLVVTHMISKLYSGPFDQWKASVYLSGIIREQEKSAGHTRTVLTGDLNMNPFDAGVSGASGFHGVMSKKIAESKYRTVQQRQYPFFYNPMWSLLGDLSEGMPGTYYYKSASEEALFWHMFDQVLIRPDLLDQFEAKSLRIVDRIGKRSLLTKQGIPDQRLASDHLPIMFKLNL